MRIFGRQSGVLYYCLLSFGAVAWPFVGRNDRLRDDMLRVFPSASVAMSDLEPMTEVEIPYRLQNLTRRQIAIVVAHQSCSCIAVRVEDPVIAPGHDGIVTIIADAPQTGASGYAAVVRASTISLSPPSLDEPMAQDLLLECTVEARRRSPFDVLPREILLEDVGENARLEFVLSVSVASTTAPSDLVAHCSTLPDASVTRLSGWDERSSGVYNTVALVTADSELTPGVHRIELEVKAGRRITLDAHVLVTCRD